MTEKRLLSGEAFKNLVLGKLGYKEGMKLYPYAEKMGISRSIMQTINEGKFPDPKNLVVVANVLSISMDELLTGEVAQNVVPAELTKQQKECLDLILGSDEGGVEDAKAILARHQVPGTSGHKRAAKQKFNLEGGRQWREDRKELMKELSSRGIVPETEEETSNPKKKGKTK